MSTYIFNVKDSFGLQSKVCVMCHQDNQLVFKKSTDSSKYQEKGKCCKIANSGTRQIDGIPFFGVGRNRLQSGKEWMSGRKHPSIHVESMYM